MSTTTTEPLPVTVADLLAHAPTIRAKYPSHLAHRWRRSQIQPPFLSRLFTSHNHDTPSASFYRIYQFFVLHDNIKLRNELEYFCCSHPSWSIASLPDPADYDDPVRYITLAVLTELMCESFNRRIELGLPRDAPAIIEDFAELQARPKIYEEAPEWAKRAREKPLEDKVFIPNAEGRTLNEDDEDVCGQFKDVGVIVQTPHIHFV
jgi:hypothetical protein